VCVCVCVCVCACVPEWMPVCVKYATAACFLEHLLPSAAVM